MDDVMDIVKEIAKNPQAFASILRESIKTVRPLLYAVCDEFLSIYDDFAGNKTFFQIYAKEKMNCYNELVKAGFSHDQAIAIMVRDSQKLSDSIKAAKGSISIKNMGV